MQATQNRVAARPAAVPSFLLICAARSSFTLFCETERFPVSIEMAMSALEPMVRLVRGEVPGRDQHATVNEL